MFKCRIGCTNYKNNRHMIGYYCEALYSKVRYMVYTRYTLGIHYTTNTNLL